MTKCYPVSLKLSGKLCVIIGGGKVAERKTQSLFGCNARIRVISPELTPKLKEWVDKGEIEYKEGNYDPEDLNGAFLVISATDREDINESVSKECLRRNILINVVDAPSKANFFVPATIRRGPLSIAVSTNGKSPLMARLIREELESLYEPEFGDFVNFLGSVRKQVIENVSNPEARQKILSALADKESIRLLRQGYLEQAKERVNDVYHSCGNQP